MPAGYRNWITRFPYDMTRSAPFGRCERKKAIVTDCDRSALPALYRWTSVWWYRLWQLQVQNVIETIDTKRNESVRHGDIVRKFVVYDGFATGTVLYPAHLHFANHHPDDGPTASTGRMILIQWISVIPRQLRPELLGSRMVPTFYDDEYSLVGVDYRRRLHIFCDVYQGSMLQRSSVSGKWSTGLPEWSERHSYIFPHRLSKVNNTVDPVSRRTEIRRSARMMWTVVRSPWHCVLHLQILYWWAGVAVSATRSILTGTPYVWR